jgi:hypothetical protein
MSAARVLGALVPLVFLIAVVGIPWMLRREKRRPTSYLRTRKYAGDAVHERWRLLPTQVQAAADAEAIAEGMVADGFDAAARARAEESVRRAVQRATEVNALFRP